MEYNTNFITDVICRVNFPSILKLEKSEALKFKEKFNSSFPRLEKSFDLELIDDEGPGLSVKKENVKWVFLSKEKDKRITLTSKYMSLLFQRYNNFDEFKETWGNIYSALLEIFKIEFFDRIGLRYINKIVIKRGNPLNWNGYINKKLITGFDSIPDLRNNIVRSMHQTIFNKEGTKINFNYGIWNDDFPNSLSSKKFILDFDCYCDSILETAEIEVKILEFIKIIYSLFEESIEDKLRDIMERKNEK